MSDPVVGVPDTYGVGIAGVREVIGFTGTRFGMTQRQKLAFMALMSAMAAQDMHIGPVVIQPVDTTQEPLAYAFVHGGCIGADADAHEIVVAVRTLLRSKIVIVVRPALDPAYRANVRGDYNHKPKPALERDQEIVDECSILVAAPRSLVEEQRSGTWATIRRARKAGKPVVILDP